MTWWRMKQVDRGQGSLSEEVMFELKPSEKLEVWASDKEMVFLAGPPRTWGARTHTRKRKSKKNLQELPK